MTVPVRRWAEMTSPGLAAAARAGDVALLPVGSIEQHGDHLPVDTDVNGPHELALEVARQRSWAIVCPPVWWGLSGAHREFPGTLTLRPFTFYNLLEDLCESVLASGFRVCLLVGHASNIPMVSTLVGEFASAGRGRLLQLNYLGFASGTFAELRRSPLGGEAHGGELETSLQLHLRPELVGDHEGATPAYLDPRRHYGLSHAPPDISVRTPVNVGFDLHAQFPDGVIGDPTAASPETGRRCWDAIVTGALAVLDEFHVTDPPEMRQP